MAPIKITSLSQLIRDINADPSGSFELAKNINATGTVYDGPVIRNRFTGTLNGEDHKIIGLQIKEKFKVNSVQGEAALFGSIGREGAVCNLHLVGGIVRSAGMFAASLAAYNYGTISDVTSSARVINTFSAPPGEAGYGAGLVDRNLGFMDDDRYSGRENVTGSGCYNGGAVGLNLGSISDCWVTGFSYNNNRQTGAWTGDFVGDNGFRNGAIATIVDCHTTGAAMGPSFINQGDYVGGFVGDNQGGLIEDCTATGRAMGGAFTGGFVGRNDGGEIENCQAYGSVAGRITESDALAYDIGGFCGENSGTLINDSSWGNVYGDGGWNTGAGVGGDFPQGLVVDNRWLGDVDN